MTVKDKSVSCFLFFVFLGQEVTSIPSNFILAVMKLKQIFSVLISKQINNKEATDNHVF